jgi:hypothetical protein
MKTTNLNNSIHPQPFTICFVCGLAALCLLAASAPARAQYAPPPPPAPFQGFLNEALRQDNPYMNAWDLGGNARFRYEIKEGSAIPGVAGSVDFRDHGADVNNEYLLGRIRLHAGYTEKWWSAYVEGRSSFAVDDERFAYANVPVVPGTVRKQGDGPESDTIDLQQAYVTLGNHKEFPLSLKVGRQELIYGEERLIGASAWNNIGRVFDAAKVRWQNEWFGADFFVSRVVIPEDGRFNVANDYDWFSGVYAISPKVPKHSLEVYFLSRNASPQAIAAEPSPQFAQPSARDIYTVGGRIISKPGELGPWDYTVEGAYQFGNIQDMRAGAPPGRRNDQAFMAVVQGGYTFVNTWATPRLGLEYAYASGGPTNGTYNTFENLFPTNHKFYGYMDFFSLQNIQDVRSILQLRPHARLSLAIEGHAFWLADTRDSFYNVGGAPRATAGYGIHPDYSSFVGTELDVIGGYALTRFAQLEVAYGHFFVGDYVQQSLSSVGGAKDANYVYIQANFLF